MAKITYSSRIDRPTIDAMRNKMEEIAALEPPRRYIGGSNIGHECSRSLWYQINRTSRDVCDRMNSYSLMAIEDGHNSEAVMAERLRLVDGVQLWTEDENGEQYGFDWGFMKGHYDGVILGLLEAPKTPHIWEHKAVNEIKFNKLERLISELGEKLALQQWDSMYYAQAIIYMEAEQLTRHYLTVSTPGCRDVISCRTEANPKFAKALIEKAQRIYRAKEPPAKIGTPDYYVCKWCNHRSVCHGN